MTHTYHIAGMTCNGCATTVEKTLKAIQGVTEVKVNLTQATVEIGMEKHLLISRFQQALAGYPAYQISERGAEITKKNSVAQGFWADRPTWKRASLNTLNCLIGCSIGDFGMILYLQAVHPGTSMALQMILAIIAGLLTSVLLETVLLRIREKFNWSLAFQTAIGMSLISMIAMELAMNTTDFMMTGGKAAFGNPMYWTALLVAMMVGFLAPLPYNYYKLKKFNKACH
jgi:copper chaperone CopZ